MTEEQTALATRHESTEIAVAEPHRTDAAQARIDSVAKVIDAAYQRASMLELTDVEAKAIVAPFDDAAIRPGAKGKEHLLYLEHASVRSRMFEVFGPGRWSLICRRFWNEEYKTAKGTMAVRVYADCVLIVRGCYVGETIGAGSYFPNNDSQDYSDAAEAAQSEALRRICGKYLGIGLQLWNKAYTEDWKKRRNRPAQQERDAEPQSQHAVSDAYKEGYHTGKNDPPPAVADAAIVAQWQERIAAEPTIDQINDDLPKIKAIGDAPTRVAVFKMIEESLRPHGIAWDSERKCFGFTGTREAVTT